MRTAVPLCLALLLAVASASDLCTSPPEGMAGAFSPTTDVPTDVQDALTEAFFANATAWNGEAFTGCDEYSTNVVDACSQVVAGMNYLVQLSLTCDTAEGTWDNGVMTVSFTGEAYKPLPSSGDPIEASIVGPIAALPKPVVALAECPTPANYTIEGFAPYPISDIPSDLLSGLAMDWLDTATFDGEEFLGCENMTAIATEACAKAGDDGETIFDVAFSLSCNDEDLEWDNGIASVSLVAIASAPINGTIALYHMELFGALPKPPKPISMDDA